MPQFDVHFLASSVFWSVVSFAILLYLLAKYALPPVLKALDEREQSIRQTINEAQRLKVEGENLIKEYEEKLAAIRKESQEILDGARLQAQRLLETNERETRARAEKILSDAKEEIERETARAIREVAATPRASPSRPPSRSCERRWTTAISGGWSRTSCVRLGRD